MTRRLHGFVLGFLLAVSAQRTATAQPSLIDLERLETIALEGNTQHVQGIDVTGSQLWVTSVDAKNKHGHLFEYELPSGKRKRSIDLTRGSRFHPGGLSADGDSLWLPVAEYKRASTTTIERRAQSNLKVEFAFTVDDHIGAIAVTPDGLLGANWDARDFYLWDKTGKLLRKFPNPYPIAVQDMKFVDGRLVISGLLPDKSGVVDWLEWPSLRQLHRIAAGSTDRGVAYTHEGMTLRNGKLWLLPEDSASRLFVFRAGDGLTK